MTIEDYIKNLNARFKTGISTEHSYRGDLQNLLESLAGDVLVTNEPARVACGAPDYILTKGNIPVGYIEAKDIGADLSSGVQNSLRVTGNHKRLSHHRLSRFQLFREENLPDLFPLEKFTKIIS
ncbi:MAG: hypothetical protein R2941_17070 [Desulfobacterales bacterium]